MSFVPAIYLARLKRYLLKGAEEELPNVLKVQDVPEENAFFQKGLGPNSEMLFGRGPLQDRRLLERILLQGVKRVQSREAGGHLPCCRDHGRRREPETKENSTLCCQGHVGVCCRFLASRGKRLQISTKLLCWSLQIKIPGVCRSS